MHKVTKGFLFVLATLIFFLGLSLNSYTEAQTNLSESLTTEADTVEDKMGKRNHIIETATTNAKEKLQDTFGGTYLEENKLIIYTKGALPDKQKSELQKTVMQQDITVEYRTVKFSKKELEDVVAKMTKDRESLLNRGIKIFSIWVDEPENKVYVGVSAEDKERANGQLPTLYNVPLTIEAEDPPSLTSTREDSPGLFKAGLRIGMGFNDDPIDWCTSGFTVRHNTLLTYFVLTAGHCALQTEEIRHAGLRIGEIGARQFQGSIDAAAFSLEWGQSSNWLFREPHWLEPINSFSTAPVGATVCAEGATSGHRCGAVVSTTASFFPNNNVTLTNMHAAAFCSQGGDSGGPVYQYGTGVGIVSGRRVVNGVCTTTFYTPTQRIANAFGVSVLGDPWQPKVLLIKHSQKYVDADIASGTGNGTRMQQWTYNGWDNQTFYLWPIFISNGRYSEWYRLQAKHNGRYITYGIDNLNGGSVIQWNQIPSNQFRQNFQFLRGTDRTVSLQSQYNSRCLDIDVAFAPYADSTKIQQWDCNGWDNQRFTLINR